MSGKRGREYFYKYRYFLKFLVKIIKILPLSVRVFLFNFSNLFVGKIGLGIRYIILKSAIKSCGDNIFIGRNVEIKGWSGLEIGDNCSVHFGSYIDATGGIKIGNNVSIAHNSSILSSTHTWDFKIPIRDNPLVFEEVIINDDVWIGCGVRILSGVTIGNRSIIAAGAVVNKDIMPSTINAGVPSKLIKKVDSKL